MLESSRHLGFVQGYIRSYCCCDHWTFDYNLSTSFGIHSSEIFWGSLLYLAYKSFKDKSSGFNLTNEDSLDYKLYKKKASSKSIEPRVFLIIPVDFIHYENGHVSIQMLVYGTLFLLQAFVIFTLISMFAGKLGCFLRKDPSLSKKINLITRILFTLIGLQIAFS